MQIAVMNHCQHDGDDGGQPYRVLADGSIALNEVIITGNRDTRITSLAYIATMSGVKSVGSLIARNAANRVIFRTKAVSGANKTREGPKYTIPQRDYMVGPFIETTDSKFSRNKVGFKAIIGPDPYDSKTGKKRSLLRIHPARSNGTEGCIGLISNDTIEMQRIEHYFKTSLNNNALIPLHVVISGY